MDENKYILMCMERAQSLLHEYIDNLSMEQVIYQPRETSNSISWIVWHTTRGFDRRISFLDRKEQVWITGKWYQKYNLPASDKDLGVGHTVQDIPKIRPSQVSDMINYFDDVYLKMIVFLKDKTIDLNKKIPETENSQGYELMRMITGTFQHWGQINYIRGLIENKIWYTGNTKEKK
tara:strand:+ start:413 stop:943 length:531 start_codon:yes stop_codon:yes gene_type:complete